MDDERLKFEHMINFVWASRAHNEPRCSTIDCPNQSLARKLRRRLYYLRDSSSGEVKARADKMAFRLNGKIVVVELMPEWQPQNQVGTEVGSNSNVEESQGNNNDHEGVLRDGTVSGPDGRTEGNLEH